jgi:hypothetical protein
MQHPFVDLTWNDSYPNFVNNKNSLVAAQVNKANYFKYNDNSSKVGK